MKEGDSIMTLNEQTTYPTWEFLYDPRIEQLKAKVSFVWRRHDFDQRDRSGFGFRLQVDDFGSLQSGSSSGSQLERHWASASRTTSASPTRLSSVASEVPSRTLSLRVFAS